MQIILILSILSIGAFAKTNCLLEQRDDFTIYSAKSVVLDNSGKAILSESFSDVEFEAQEYGVNTVKITATTDEGIHSQAQAAGSVSLAYFVKANNEDSKAPVQTGPLRYVMTCYSK